MKKLFEYLKQFIKEDFNFGYYASVLIFLSLAIFSNYFLGFNELLRKDYGEFYRIFFYLFFFALPYFFSLLVYSVFNKDYSILKSKKNLIVIFAMLLVLGFNASSYLFFQLGTIITVPAELNRLFLKCLVNIVYAINFLIALIIFRLTINRDLPDFFGLTLKGVNWRLYLPLLTVPILLTIFASFNHDFLKAYPTYDAGDANSYLGVSPLFTISVYEILYGIQFFFVELFFRGFLVIGMIKLLGRPAVLSMVCGYAFWHFGKPPLEAISSIFGGYFLGVLAYYTRNIWGGIILHVGIAWSMDVSTIIQKWMIGN